MTRPTAHATGQGDKGEQSPRQKLQNRLQEGMQSLQDAIKRLGAENPPAGRQKPVKTR